MVNKYRYNTTEISCFELGLSGKVFRFGIRDLSQDINYTVGDFKVLYWRL